MKFRFYITNTFDGSLQGTNDKNTAEELAACEEYFVVDADSGEWLTSEGSRDPVEEIQGLVSEGDENE